MKKLLLLTKLFFSKRKTFSSIISEALAEGIRDTMSEMGYKFERKEDK